MPAGGWGGVVMQAGFFFGGGGGSWLFVPSTAHAIPPVATAVGRRQEAAESSLTWISWRSCGRPAARCQAPACTSCPGREVGGQGGRGGLWAPCPKIQPLPPPRQRRVVGEKPGRGVGCGDSPPHPPGGHCWFQAGDRQVSVAGVLLARDLGTLQDVGVASPPQNCPLCQMSCFGGGGSWEDPVLPASLQHLLLWPFKAQLRLDPAPAGPGPSTPPPTGTFRGGVRFYWFVFCFFFLLFSQTPAVGTTS